MHSVIRRCVRAARHLDRGSRSASLVPIAGGPARAAIWPSFGAPCSWFPIFGLSRLHARRGVAVLPGIGYSSFLDSRASLVRYARCWMRYAPPLAPRRARLVHRLTAHALTDLGHFLRAFAGPLLAYLCRGFLSSRRLSTHCFRGGNHLLRQFYCGARPASRCRGCGGIDWVTGVALCFWLLFKRGLVWARIGVAWPWSACVVRWSGSLVSARFRLPGWQSWRMGASVPDAPGVVPCRLAWWPITLA